MTPNAPTEGRAARILNVDDSDGARYVKSRVLQLAGYEVIEARSGGEAMELVSQCQPELVLLDVRLPDISGLDVCRQIKSASATRHVLVLQTSASLVDSAHRVKALDAGADSYLVEPIEPEELVANVRALLRLRRAEEAHRRATHALNESEERFRQLADAISDVFWMLDLGGGAPRFLYVSPAYAKQWGHSAERVLDDALHWFAVMHPDDRDRMREHWSAPQRHAYAAEYRMRTAAGDERWIAERAYPVPDEAGQPYRLAGVSQDITARKRAELLLVEADRHKNEFLAMLSHELRNPLAPIRNAVDLLSMRTRDDDDALGRSVRIIGRQVEHLARLVEDLLDVSRISQGKIALSLDWLPLDQVVGSAVETTRPLIAAKQQTLQLSLPEPAVWLHADRVRLAQVFVNLLNNASKFTPPHGHLGVEARLVGDEVEVSVVDDGAGMAADVLPRVFDLFTQADQTLDRSQGGLGIGLSLVRRIVELHHGRTWAESDGAGKGSRFILRLPMDRASPQPAAPALASPQVRPLRVLVVDDNTDSVETMALLLESQGHAVFTANNGESAIEQARDLEPDVVLLDIGLPGMSGYDVARALRAMQSNQPLLVAISGYGRDSDRQLAREAGFNHHLVKPADPEQIFSIMAAV